MRWPPILLYHSVTDDRLPFSVPIEVFKRQMAHLYRCGFHPITIDEIPMWQDAKLQVDNPVCITFDDGFRDNVINALPILRRYGFRATVFVATKWAGSLDTFHGHRMVDWADLLEWRNHGCAVGSHTVTHADLMKLSSAEAFEELRASKLCIEDKLQAPVASFAYPYGHVTAGIKDRVCEAGYQVACAVKLPISLREDRFLMQRISINCLDAGATFNFKLSLLYRLMIRSHIAYYLSRDPARLRRELRSGR